MKTMKVYWCKCGPRDGNFGDKLTSLLLDYLGIPHTWASPERAEVFGIGSILEAIPVGFTGIVWTSGQMHETTRKDLRNARVFSLRGPETLCRTQVRASDDIPVGDGGLLVDLVYRRVRRRYKLGIVPHFLDASDPIVATVAATSPEIIVIDVCRPPLDVIQQIGQCQHVLSSSLHGLIVADSLGIPSEWIELNQGRSKVQGQGFKFRDYFRIYGIDDKRPSSLGPSDDLDALLTLVAGSTRPGLSEIKARLLDTLREFPRDYGLRLWTGAHLPIMEREAVALQRLEPSFRPPPPASALDSESPRARLVPLSTTVAPQRRQLADLFRDCIELLRHLRSRGIAHRAITVDRVLLRDGKPLLEDFGWAVLEDPPLLEPSAPNGSPGSPLYDADVRAMGRVLSAVCGAGDPTFAAIADLMTEPESRLGTTDLDLLDSAVRAASDDVADGAATRMARHLLSRAALLARSVGELKTSMKRQAAHAWELQWSLARYELEQIIPATQSFVLVDGGRFSTEEVLLEGRRHLPFTELNGDYGGAPADGKAALVDLDRILRIGVPFLVFTWPAFWWLEHYSELEARLNSQFRCVFNNERVVVFDLRPRSSDTDS